MRRLLLGILVATLGMGLLTPSAHALHDFSLKQQGELPRDQYLDLVDPGHYYLDRLVVKFVEDTRVRLRDEQLVSLEGHSLSAVDVFLKAHPEIQVARLIDTMKEDELDAYVARGERMSGFDVADMNNYYLFKVTDRNGDPRGLLADLLKLDLVQTGYYEPIPEPATCGNDPAPTTPDYVPDQDYREAAPTGIDINYAWALSPAYGKGRNIDRFQDLEQGWCESHEDFPSLVIRNPPDATTEREFNHGTAVVSIVGACDDGKGVSGLTPNVYMTARVVTNHTSTAASLTAIGGDLLTGEVYLIEMHAPGPAQGDTCVCNCEQFEFIAMEYWQGNFDAILANSTNGRYCIEAAGNGSMDLDWSGYNRAFDLTFRDSQAIVVGAGTSGVEHNATCWTNHGTRISAYSWGENVYAAGYGNVFNQADCEQDYTWSFGGTSSASPIVTGAAISLSTIHGVMYGSYLSPLDLRARLQLNGTPQGPFDTWKELNVQPNMKGILAPDLAPYNPGWAAVIVPSDVTGTSTLPGALWPAPANTYFDFCWANESHYAGVPYAPATLSQDDVPLFNASSNMGTYSFAAAFDWAAPIRGGLHYIKLDCDPYNLHVDESVEGNNRVALAYRWRPTALWSDTPQYFSRGPKRNPWGAGSYALDGYGNGGGFPGWWDVTGVMSSGGADYDIHLYNTNPTPTNGWTSPVATSEEVGYVDFVGCNNNAVSDGDFVGVVNYSDSENGYIVERQGSQYLGSAQFPPVHVGDFDLTVGEILDVYEIACTAGQPVWLNIDLTFGSADVAVFVFGPYTTYFGRGNAFWTLDNGGAGADEAGIFTPSQSGDHGVVVCKNLSSDLAGSANYSLIWGTPVGDMTHVTPAGWTAPVVARNNGGLPIGVLPVILSEGAARADAGLINIGGVAVAAGTNQAFYLDGPAVFTSGDLPAYSPGVTAPTQNRLIGTVKGGRHELGSRLDINNEAVEQSPNGETNNAWFTQYVWAPLALADNTPLLRSPAPNWINLDNPDSGSQAGYNQDGYTLTTSDWTAVATMPADAGTQLDMLGYNYASTDPLTALVGPATFDSNAPGRIVMVLANGIVTGNGVGFDAGVMNNYGWPQVPPTGNYTVQLAQTQSVLSLGAPMVNTLAGDPVTGGQLIHVYEIHLGEGMTVPLTLFNNSAADLGVSIFAAGQDFATGSGALATFDVPGAGAGEMGSFTAAATGYYGVAVYRSGSADLGPDASYALVLGSWAPAAVTSLVVTMTETEGSDDYLHLNLQWDDVSTDIHGNPLAVDHYNVYWSYLPYGPWYFVSSPAVSEVLDLPAYVGYWTNSYYMVTAVDGNGVLVGASTSHSGRLAQPR